LAPRAAMLITSCAPRLAGMNASAVIQVARLRPDWKKSRPVLTKRLSATPMPMTKTK